MTTHPAEGHQDAETAELSGPELCSHLDLCMNSSSDVCAAQLVLSAESDDGLFLWVLTALSSLNVCADDCCLSV